MSWTELKLRWLWIIHKIQDTYFPSTTNDIVLYHIYFHSYLFILNSFSVINFKVYVVITGSKSIVITFYHRDIILFIAAYFIKNKCIYKTEIRRNTARKHKKKESLSFSVLPAFCGWLRRPFFCLIVNKYTSRSNKPPFVKIKLSFHTPGISLKFTHSHRCTKDEKHDDGMASTAKYILYHIGNISSLLKWYMIWRVFRTHAGNDKINGERPWDF